MTSRRGEFRPWANDLKFGAVLTALGLALLWLSWHNQALPLAIVGVIAGWLGQKLFRRGMLRRRGKRLETDAIRAVDLPKGWLFKPNRMVHTGGDIDLYIESPAKQGFAIEIKSIESIKAKRTWLGLGETQFLSGNGKPLRVDPVPQTMRNAQAVGATPVLWLPKGDAKTIKLGSGLIIVQGNKKRLLRAIGARGWFF